MRKLSLFLTQSVKPGPQRGQAMTEFTIAAACVLVPLFLMLPYLGKYMDMKATSIQAARYAAWERTVWYGSDQWESGQKNDGQIKNEVVQRFFNDTAGEALKSTDMAAPTSSPKELWRDHAGETILGNTNSTTCRSPPCAGSSTPGTINTYLAAFRSGVNLVGAVLDTNFKLDTSSLYTSIVTLTAEKTDAMARAWNGDVLKGGNVDFTAPTFTEKNVLVANGWSANGRAFVKKQTEGLAVFNVFNRSPVSDVMVSIQQVVGIFVEELRPSSLALGVEIKPDYVPPDRLSAAAVTAVRAAPAPTPRKSPEQEAIDRDAAARASAAPIQAKARALDQGITNTGAAIDSCKAAKTAEFRLNTGHSWPLDRGEKMHEDHIIPPTSYNDELPPRPEGYRLVYHITVYMGDPNWDPRYIKSPGPGGSYTPIFDANVACNGRLDQRIADLQAKLNDPDLQKAKTESDSALRNNPTLANDPVFMENKRLADKVISDYQTRIDILTTERNLLRGLPNVR
jgi:hypothetical protein